MKEISVIIPHYNSFDTLPILIDSIPDDPDIEVIVVDDKSEDQEQYDKIIYKYKDKNNVIFLKNVSNSKGAGTCRNIGLDNASGKWLVFADADDYFVLNAFSVLKKYCNSEHDIIFFHTTSLDRATGKLSDRHICCCNMVDNHLVCQSKLSENLLRYYWSMPWGKLIRNNLVKNYNIRFDELTVSNDVMFSMKTGYYAGSISACRDVIYCITKSPNTLTTSININNLHTRIDVNINRFIFLKQRLDQSEFKQMGICGGNWIIDALGSGYGIKVALYITKKFIQNKVSIFSFKLIRNYRILYGKSPYS